MPDDLVSLHQPEWERGCPESITSDPIWNLLAYRSSLFLLALARADLRVAVKRGLHREIAAQLLEAVASISANLSEGYSRGTRGDRLRFYGYALGSLRESVSWYLAASDCLPAGTDDQRLEFLARTRRLLLGLIKSTRARSRREFEA